MTNHNVWNSMDTAPKDGTFILLRAPWEESGAVIAFWSDPSIGDTTEDEAGWYISECSSHRIYRDVTGWAPLPTDKEEPNENG